MKGRKKILSHKYLRNEDMFCVHKKTRNKRGKKTNELTTTVKDTPSKEMLSRRRNFFGKVLYDIGDKRFLKKCL